MKPLLTLLAASLTTCALAAEIGEVVYEKSFAQWPAGWAAKPQGCAKLVDGALEINTAGPGSEGVVGNRDLLGKVERTKASSFTICAGLMEQMKNLKGYELEVETSIKGEAIPVPQNPWSGVRMSVNYATTTGPYSDIYYNMLSGTFDWKKASYRIRIPSDLTNMSMDMGLLQPSGNVWFDHLKMTVTDTPFTMKKAAAGTPYRGYAVPRLRGFVTGIREPGNDSGRNTLANIATEWKANVAKLWFHVKTADLKQIDEDFDKWLASVDASLASAKENRLYLILHMDTKKGFSLKEHGGSELLYEKPECAGKFIALWKKAAEHFKGRKEIYAFELLNETCLRMQIADGCYDYLTLMEKTAQAINEVDPERAIIVQTEEWWGPRAFYKMRPLKAKNIVYAVHFYSPFPVSHQGVGEWYAKKTSWMANAYPGTYDGILWNKDTLKRDLQPVRDFQKAYNVQIIVSEFSCIRWALGCSREKLIKDMIDIYEEYGWDWLYHGYPEFNGWMPQLGADPWNERRPATPTAVETLLKEWFAKNQRPEL